MKNNNRVTQAQIDKLMRTAEITTETKYDKMTIVTVKLENGFLMTESSACVDPGNYDEKVGKAICLERIENRLWELEGYCLQKALYETPRAIEIALDDETSIRESMAEGEIKPGRAHEHYPRERISTIQKRNNLNDIYRTGEPGPGGAYHDYDIYPVGMSVGFEDEFTEIPMACIEFQKGPRDDAEARHGVLDTDLLEIVRDRLKAFQSSPYATRENACALTHIEEALMWMNKRVEDRAERGVLGTVEK